MSISVGRIFSRGGDQEIFPKLFLGGAKIGEICFFPLETKKTTFFTIFFKIQRVALPPLLPIPTPMDMLTVPGCTKTRKGEFVRQYAEKCFGLGFTAKHIDYIIKSCNFYIRNIGRIRQFLSKNACEMLVVALVTSRLDYCNSLLTVCHKRTCCDYNAFKTLPHV